MIIVQIGITYGEVINCERLYGDVSISVGCSDFPSVLGIQFGDLDVILGMD